MADPVPFAYFKDWKVGDYLTALRPQMALAGQHVAIASTVSANTATINDRGARASYELEILANLRRSHSGSEDEEHFIRRAFSFLADAKEACGLYPSGSLLTSGVLACGFDEDTIFGFDNAETAGAGVTIELDGTVTVAAGELWFVFDPSTGIHELIVSASPQSDQIVAVALANNYTDASKAFRAIWAAPAVFLDPSITLPSGDDAGDTEAIRDVAVRFVGIDAPIWGASPA